MTITEAEVPAKRRDMRHLKWIVHHAKPELTENVIGTY
jgi:hypothetical protein